MSIGDITTLAKGFPDRLEKLQDEPFYNWLKKCTSAQRGKTIFHKMACLLPQNGHRLSMVLTTRQQRPNAACKTVFFSAKVSSMMMPNTNYEHV